MAIRTSSYPGFAPDIPRGAAPDELWPEGWTDAELRDLATDAQLPEAAPSVDRSGTPGVRWRRVVCWVKGHYPVEIWSWERHHHTECGRCPKRWTPEEAPLPAESQIV